MKKRDYYRSIFWKFYLNSQGGKKEKKKKKEEKKKKKKKKKIIFNENFIKIFNYLKKRGSDINFCNSRGENLLIYIYNKRLLNIKIFLNFYIIIM